MAETPEPSSAGRLSIEVIWIGVEPPRRIALEVDDGTTVEQALALSGVAGLIHDIPTVKELIDRIMREAEEIITKRLMGAVRG